MKKLFYGMGIVVLFLLAGFLLVRTSTSLLLATDRGQEVARNVIEKQAQKRNGLRVKVDRIGGTLFNSAQLEGVRIADEHNDELLRARRIDLKYDLWSLLRKRPEITATLVEPVISGGMPLPDVRDLDANVEIRDGALGKELSIERGQLRVKRHDEHWNAAFSGQIAGRKLPRSMQVHVNARGPVDALQVEATVDTGRGQVHLDGLADLPHQRMKGDLAVDELAVDFLPSASIMVLRGNGNASLEDGKVSLRFDATYQRLTPPADLVGVVTPAERRRLAQPASRGKLHAEGEGRLEDGINLQFRAQLVDAGGASRLVQGGGAQARSMVVVDGQFSRRERHPAVLRVRSRTVPIR